LVTEVTNKLKVSFFSLRYVKVCWLCLASTLVPQWLNANTLTLDEFVSLIPRWEAYSNSPNTVIGDGGSAYGLYQIHNTMVQDYNRITGRKVAHVVAFDPVFSAHIAKTVLAHYTKAIKRKGITPTVDHWLFIWNGGGGAWVRVHNPQQDSKQRNLELYRTRARTIILEYINEKKRRQSPKRT